MAGAVTAWSLLLQADDSRRSCKHAQLMVSTKLHTCAALFDHPSLPACKHIQLTLQNCKQLLPKGDVQPLV